MSKKELRRTLLARQNGLCARTGREITASMLDLCDLERILPKSQGGDFTPDNLRLVIPATRLAGMNARLA